MNIGIVCYASVGGSGIIATELGKRLAVRGHRVHVLSSDMPVRFGPKTDASSTSRDRLSRVARLRLPTPSFV